MKQLCAGFNVRQLLKITLLASIAFMASLSSVDGRAADPETLTAVQGNPMAADLSLHDLDGKTVRLPDLRGKVVLVNFWATWCPPCRREMPTMERLSQALKGQPFTVVAVNVAEDPDTVFSFTGTLEPIPTFPILLDQDGQALKSWPVKGLPTSFIIDRQGRLIYRAVGGRAFDDPEIISKIRDLIKG